MTPEAATHYHEIYTRYFARCAATPATAECNFNELYDVGVDVDLDDSEEAERIARAAFDAVVRR